MSNKRFEYYFLAWFAATTLAYQYIQDSLRPGYTGTDPSAKYLLGVAPNFFPAVGLPALFVVLLPYVFTNRAPTHYLVAHKGVVANAISLSGLIAWECAQAFTRGAVFDMHDIASTLLGGLLFRLVWRLAPGR